MFYFEYRLQKLNLAFWPIKKYSQVDCSNRHSSFLKVSNVETTRIGLKLHSRGKSMRTRDCAPSSSDFHRHDNDCNGVFPTHDCFSGVERKKGDSSVLPQRCPCLDFCRSVFAARGKDPRKSRCWEMAAPPSFCFCQPKWCKSGKTFASNATRKMNDDKP